MVPRRLGAFLFYKNINFRIKYKIINIFLKLGTHLITHHILILRDRYKEVKEMVLIGKYLIIGSVWLGMSYLGLQAKKNFTMASKSKLSVMSCRRQLKRYEKINNADKESIF